MRIAMSGATGFVGSHLTKAFIQKGWQVLPLTRQDFMQDGGAVIEKIEGSAVVVNLAGATVAARWTEEYKKIMYSSRIDTTKKICRTLGKAKNRPRLLISTSAIGIYTTEGVHTEEDRNYSKDFLGKLAADWEAAAGEAKDLGVRTLIFRFGVVLGRNGGALQKMLIPFRLGLGGVIGSGEQPFSWVHIEDLIRAYVTVIENDKYEGVYNLTAPHPTTNRGLTEALGHVLHRPTFMHVPFFVLKLQLGEAAKVLTEGQHVLPQRLLESGFSFMFTDIDKALENLVTAEG